jgi:hypothetical protein
MRTSTKITIGGLIALVVIPLVAYLLLYCYTFSVNMNPDHVNLNKDGWVRFVSFKTGKKNVLVEVYARAGKEKNSGEFVVARKGVLWFGMQAVTPVFKRNHVWSKVYECKEENGGVVPCSDKMCAIIVSFGYCFLAARDEYRRWPCPSVELSSAFDKIEKRFVNQTIYHKNCDYIPGIEGLIDYYNITEYGKRPAYSTATEFYLNSDIWKTIPVAEE